MMHQSELLIINCCLTGNVPTKEDNTSVPLFTDEIIQDGLRVAKLGATILHIHARDENGMPTYKKEVFETIIKGIRKKDKNAVICVTTSGRLYKKFKERSQVLNLKGDAKPDFASLTLGSLNFPKETAENSPEMIVKLANKMKQNNIQPEWEVFEPGMLNYGMYLVKKGVLDPPRWINIFLGSLGTSPATVETLSLFRSMIPPQWRWSAVGVGRFQRDISNLSMMLGGHVRIGLEDAVYMDPEKKELATNAKLIKRTVNMAKCLGRKVARVDETRKILGV